MLGLAIILGRIIGIAIVAMPIILIAKRHIPPSQRVIARIYQAYMKRKQGATNKETEKEN